jgi:hypothetical protein
MSEAWDGDDYGDEGLEAEASEPAPAPRRRRKILEGKPRKGNTRREDVPTARRQAVAAATGRKPAEPEEWWGQLAQGDRDKAASTLTSRTPTHHAGSGFGLA